MEIIPAIDILGGKCVRLMQGDYFKVEEFSENPLEIAKRFVKAGAKRMHVIDLDGAREGRMMNWGVIEEICKMCKVQAGGGIRTSQEVKKAVSCGADAIIGTGAVDGGAMLEGMENLRERLVLAVDARKGKVMLEGWKKGTDADAVEFAKRMQKYFSRIVFTAIEKDGMMQGPDVGAVKRMADAVGIPLIASGGIRSRLDIAQLQKAGASGAVIGKAFYTGRIDLKRIIREFGD